MISEELDLKRRDKKIELFLLFGLWKFKKAIKLLKRNCRCYLDYYTEQNKELDFTDLNYIVSRIVAQYNITHDKEILKNEINSFENPFCKAYVKNRVDELLNISDTKRINLVGEAVI